MTTTYLNPWLSLLETSCAQAAITHLDIIIDQAGSDNPLLPSVLSVEPPLLWYSLFTGLPEEGHLELAPLLVRVDLAQPLQKHWLTGLMHALERRSQLLVLASHWPFQTLAEHVGHCLNAQNGGRSALLRYYDPRLFPLLFSHVLNPEQQQLWLRPAVFWSWLDRDGALQRLLGTAGTAEGLEALEPIEFSDRQVDSLGCVSDAALALENLSAVLPDGCGVEQCFQACYDAMVEATQAGIVRAADREAFALYKVRDAWAHLAKRGGEPHA